MSDDMKDEEMDDVKVTGKDVTYRQKLLQTVWLVMAACGTGAALYIRGPALLDLQRSTGTTVDQITAAVFVTIALGWAAGSLVGGLLYDRYSKQLLIAACCALSGAVVIVLPWCTNVILLAFVVLLSGALIAASSTGVNVMLLNLWGEGAAPYLQFQEFVFSAGGVIAILILDAFVGPSPKVYKQSAKCSSWKNGSETVYYVNHSSSNITYVEVAQNKTNVNHIEKGSNFEYAYTIIGIYIILTSLPFLIYYIRKIDLLKSLKQEKHEKDEREKTDNRKRRLQIAIISCFIVFFFFLVGSNESFYGFLTTFTVHHLCWDRSAGNLIPSVAWASTAVMQLLAIVLAKCFKPNKIIVSSISLVTVDIIVLTFTAEKSNIAMWVCAAFYGIAAAPIFPNTLAWLNNHIEVTGTIMAIISVAVGLGAVTTPALIGWLFENVSPLWYLYVMLISCCVCTIVLYTFVRIGSKHGERTQNVRESLDTKSDPVEMDSLTRNKDEPSTNT